MYRTSVSESSKINDELSTNPIKYVATEIILLISFILNNSFKQGYFHKGLNCHAFRRSLKKAMLGKTGGVL